MGKTEDNLKAAFAGESQARNRYTYFASIAKKEGYEQIAAIFLDTADNEKEHAKIFFEYLEKSQITLPENFKQNKWVKYLIKAYDDILEKIKKITSKEEFKEILPEIDQISGSFKLGIYKKENE